MCLKSLTSFDGFERREKYNWRKGDENKITINDENEETNTKLVWARKRAQVKNLKRRESIWMKKKATKAQLEQSMAGYMGFTWAQIIIQIKCNVIRKYIMVNMGLTDCVCNRDDDQMEQWDNINCNESACGQIKKDK